MEKKPIRYEKTFDDGSTEFLDKENTENFLSNLALADGICLSRGYISFKPVVWTPYQPSEQKPPEPLNVIGATVEKNTILSKHLGDERIDKQSIRYAVYNAMQEYAILQRNEAIQECIQILSDSETKGIALRELEKLKI